MRRPLFQMFNRHHSKLPVYELAKCSVMKPHARSRPLPESSGEVKFDAWRLFHAVTKADYLQRPAPSDVWTRARGTLIENNDLFDWNENNWRLKEGKSAFYADSTRTGISGRIGQGMALLFLEDRGYAYVGRFESEWKQRAATQDRQWPAERRKAPDFIAENVAKQWVLAESKGGFSPRGKQPPIKNALKKGLGQLDGWDKRIDPQPIKSFAIGTFLRETGDDSKEPSLIAFVDPEPESPENPVVFPLDTVRRANYASWLSCMGLADAADRLRNGAGDPKEQKFLILKLSGQEYAVRIVSASFGGDFLSDHHVWHLISGWLLWDFRWLDCDIDIELVGLDLSVLETISLAIKSPKETKLMDLKPTERRAAPADKKFYGSVFSDGSLMGVLRLRSGDRSLPHLDMRTLEL